MKKKNQLSNKRWSYVIVSVLLMLIYGTVYSWGIFRVPVETYYNVGATLSGLPYMTFLLMYAISMLIGGKLMRRFAPKKILMTGGLLISLGWMLSSISSHIVWLTIFYGVVIGFGVGISYGVPIYVIAHWFTEKRGMVVGIVLAGFGLSPALTAPLGQWLILTYGLRATFLYYGIAFGVLILLLSQWIQVPEQRSQKQKKEKVNSTSGMVRQKSFKYAYSSFLVGTLIGLTIIGLTNNVGRDLIGIGTDQIAYMMVIFAIFNGLGRPLFGWMTEKYGPKFAMNLSFILIFISANGMLFAGKGTTVLYMIIFSVLWLNLGAWLAIAPMMTMKMYGMDAYSSNYGIMFTAYGLGAVIGVVSTGLMIDLFQNYKIIFVFIIALSVVGYFLSSNVSEEINVKFVLKEESDL